MADELAGQLRERVAIETWVAARDDAGADAGFWRPEGSVFADVVPDGGAGSVAGEARRSDRRWRVTLRRPVAVTLTSRLIWASRILAVLAVDDDPRRADRLVVRCEARSR
jgi:head-tail adaptor